MRVVHTGVLPPTPYGPMELILLKDVRPDTEALRDQLLGEGGFAEVTFRDSTGYELGRGAAMTTCRAERELWVFLNCRYQEPKPDHGESSIAHELLHAVLMFVKGFPRLHMPAGSDQQRRLNSIAIAVQDLWVNRELSQMGYERPPLAELVEILRDRAVRGTLLRAPGRSGEVAAAIQLARFRHPTQGCHWEQVQEVLRLPEMPAQVVDLVDAMEPTLRDGDPFHPDGHKQMIEDLARAAGWDKEIVWRYGRSEAP
jgi:hypothetical protein